jgi:integrase
VKKRGNGEGSVFKRKDERWYARYTVRTVNGLKRRDVYGETYKEVIGKLRKALDESHQGSVRTSENLGDFLRNWLANSVSGSVSPRTYERYEQIIRLHIEPALEHASILAIVPGDHVVTARCEGCGTYGNPREFSEVGLGGVKAPTRGCVRRALGR